MRGFVWIGIVGLLVSAGCSGAGGGSIVVMREGHAAQSFGALTCAVSQPDPSRELRLVECVNGDPESQGVELVTYFQAPLAGLAEGTRLEHGPDFAVSAVSGASGGTIWGASGDPSWWIGDLSLTIGEETEEGLSAVFEGTIETSDFVDVVPITVDFTGAPATLR